MIFYFTGTGNSYHTARVMAEVTKEEMVNISQAMKQQRYEYTIGPKERIGFIFPVYYWGIPTVVEDFLKKIQINKKETHFVYAVLTCGASIGTTMTQLRKLLRKKNIELNSGYSASFPDNYVLLYDVADEEEQKQQQKAGDQFLESIKANIENRSKEIFQITRGKAPHLLSGLLHNYYKKNRKTKSFNVTDACISCGLCEKICPVETISLTNGLPQWGKECTQCLGCIHRCPVHAIQYGRKTKKRRRYVHPDLLNEK